MSKRQAQKEKEAAEKVERIARAIKPHLAGISPEMQSAVLADLMAMYLAGHPDFVRQNLMRLFVDLVWKLMPVNEKLIFGDDGHPQNREDQTKH